MNKKFLSTLIIFIVIISIGFGVFYFYYYKYYYKEGKKMSQAFEEGVKISDEEFYSTVRVTDSRKGHKPSEVFFGKRILRTEVKNFIYKELGVIPFFPVKLPEDLFWGDIDIKDDNLLFEIGKIGQKQELSDIESLSPPIIFVSEHKNKPVEWEQISANQKLAKEVVFNNIKFSGFDRISSDGQLSGRLIKFKKDEVWVIIVVLKNSADYFSIDDLLEIAKSLQ